MTAEQASAHTPEPWKPAPGQTEIFGDVGSRASDVMGEVSVGRINKPEDRRRIVACVNACAGLPIEDLEQGQPGYALGTLSSQLEQARAKLAEVEKARDTLLKRNQQSGEYQLL